MKIDHALERRASPVVPVQPDDQRRGARGRRRGRTSGAVQHVSIDELRRRPSPRQLGLDRRAAHGESPERRREHVQQERVLAERRSELAETGICIPNAVDCNQNFGIISFSEFSTWGGSSYNGTEQPRFSIKDDLTISTGSHTIKAGFTYDRQQANGFGQQDIGGRAGFSFLETGDSRRDHAGQRRRQLVRVVPARRGRHRQDRDDPLSAAGLSVLRVLRAGRLADQRQAGRSTTACATSSRSRRTAGGDQYSDLSPTKPNPAVNNYPGALIFAGDGPGREGTSSAVPRLLRRAGAAREFRATARTTRRSSAAAWADPSDASRSRRAAATSPGSSVSTCSRRPMPA